MLLARDTLVTELSDLAAGVLGHPRTVRDDLLTSSPPHALHAALTDLPLTGEASAGERRLTDALAAPGGPLTRAWQDTARAAVALERYHHQLPARAGPDAWAVARDTAELLDRMTDADWARQGTHSESGPYGVEDWLRIYAGHAHDHANQIRRAREAAP